jgi:hypothetical protein
MEADTANTLLDRAYGKPAVKEEKEIVDSPKMIDVGPEFIAKE